MAEASDAARDQRIAALEARAAITDLVHRYALNIREGRLDAFEALFTADAEFIVLSFDPVSATATERFRHVGRPALTAYLGTPGRSGFRVVPLIRNLLIDVDGDSASATCIMTSRTWPQGGEVFGEYRDRFRLEDRWRFCHRTFIVHARPAPAD